MNRKIKTATFAMPLLFAMGATGPSSSAKIDKSNVQHHLTKARTAAGREYVSLFRALCPGETMPGSPTIDQADPDTWYTPPAKVFDNLYYVGQSSVSAWALVTDKGIILIDSLFSYSVKPEIEDGLKRLGLDAANIRYVIVTHGHKDHIGGAAYLQERGARIVLATDDWSLVERTQPDGPRRDIAINSRQSITLGDTSVELVPTPGHTSGTLSLIFPVRDKGERHVAALWGGVSFNSRTRKQYVTYAKSARTFARIAAKAHADVTLSNHPIIDRTFDKLATMRNAANGETNPFLSGEKSVQAMLDVAHECAVASRLAEGK